MDRVTKALGLLDHLRVQSPLPPGQGEFWTSHLQRIQTDTDPARVHDRYSDGRVPINQPDSGYQYTLFPALRVRRGSNLASVFNVLREADRHKRPTIELIDPGLADMGYRRRNGLGWLPVRSKLLLYPLRLDGRDYVLVPNTRPNTLYGPVLGQLGLENFDGRKITHTPIDAPFGLPTRLRSVAFPNRRRVNRLA